MGGNKAGGKLTAKILTERDPDYYRKIGQAGGKSPKTRPSGFAAMPRHIVSEWGVKGGTVSRRGEHNKLSERDRKIALLRLKASQE